MANKRLKIQLTLPQDLVEKIEKDKTENFMSISLWFEKIVRNYFNEKEKMNKKVIELDI